jgi:hypothetical protein
LIQVRRLHLAPGETVTVGALLVRRDEQDIGPIRHLSPLANRDVSLDRPGWAANASEKTFYRMAGAFIFRAGKA